MFRVGWGAGTVREGGMEVFGRDGAGEMYRTGGLVYIGQGGEGGGGRGYGIGQFRAGHRTRRVAYCVSGGGRWDNKFRVGGSAQCEENARDGRAGMFRARGHGITPVSVEREGAGECIGMGRLGIFRAGSGGIGRRGYFGRDRVVEYTDTGGLVCFGRDGTGEMYRMGGLVCFGRGGGGVWDGTVSGGIGQGNITGRMGCCVSGRGDGTISPGWGEAGETDGPVGPVYFGQGGMGQTHIRVEGVGGIYRDGYVRYVSGGMKQIGGRGHFGRDGVV